jgi:pimeloyl-ACP methyl ester carboxylesterase
MASRHAPWPDWGESVRVPTALGALAVQVHGEGAPTVLWHSMYVDGSSWDRIIPLLADGRRLLVVDGPGWGDSDHLHRTVRMPDAVGAAAELVAALSPGAPVDWVGNAWGGHVGIELAATRPELVRSLVAAGSPLLPVAQQQRGRIELLIRVLRVAGPIGPVRDGILPALLTPESAADPSAVAFVVDALARAGRRSAAHAIRSFTLNRVDITELLPRVTAPTLFVATPDRDEWTPDQATAAAAVVPKGRAAVVQGARALIPIEQPDALAALITDFWGSLEHRP